MERKALFVTESKENINKMKNINDKKIRRMEVAGSLLKNAMIGVGVVTAMDFFSPDLVFSTEEVALTMLTALLGCSAYVVDNKAAKLKGKENPVNNNDSKSIKK